MLDSKESTDVDFQLIVLEELFAEECKCEFTHISSSCSSEVTHRISSCEAVINSCKTGAMVCESKMLSTEQLFICRGCKAQVKDCWTVRVI